MKEKRQQKCFRFQGSNPSLSTKALSPRQSPQVKAALNYSSEHSDSKREGRSEAHGQRLVLSPVTVSTCLVAALQRLGEWGPWDFSPSCLRPPGPELLDILKPLEHVRFFAWGSSKQTCTLRPLHAGCKSIRLSTLCAQWLFVAMDDTAA